VREIKIEDLSPYILRQMDDQVKAFIKDCKGVQGLQKPFLTLPGSSAHFILSQSNPEYSTLSETLKKPNITIEVKIRLLAQIASTMQELVKAGPGYSHGHLHPNNILVDHYI
jgi:hypothetical protein